jgi:hypothetical protein
MRIDSAGNVGIGTTSPGFKLHVRGPDATANLVVGNTTEGTQLEVLTYQDDKVVLRANDTSNVARILAFEMGLTERGRFDTSGNLCVGSSSAGNAGTLNVSVGNPGTTTGGLQLWSTTGGAHYVHFGDGTSGTDPYRGYVGYAHASDALIFGTATTEKARITTGGNLLLGTTSDFNTITIGSVSNANGISWNRYMNVFSEFSSGASYISSNYYPTQGASGYKTSLTASFGAAGMSISGTSGGSNSGLIQFFVDPTTSKTSGDAFTPTERMRIDSAGNVGIGSTSITTGVSGTETTLFLKGNSSGKAASFVAANNAGTGAGYFGVGTNDFTFLISKTNHALVLGTNDTERARIDSSGNLLVGTTNTSNSALINWYKESGTIETSLGGTTAAQNHIVFANPNGNVGSIQVSGSATSFNTSSDYRLKHDIQPMQNALATVAQLKPVTYKWNADDSESQGFIAHELQEVVPECVTGEKDAVDAEGKPQYQGIDTSFLVATLTAAIQEQQAIIEQLKARLDAANL